MLERYQACLVLCGAGDALGFHRGHWEFSKLDAILKDVEQFGGVEKVSDCLYEKVFAICISLPINSLNFIVY